MVTKKRITKGGIVYHALNRANGKLRIFKITKRAQGSFLLKLF